MTEDYDEKANKLFRGIMNKIENFMDLNGENPKMIVDRLEMITNSINIFFSEKSSDDKLNQLIEEIKSTYEFKINNLLVEIDDLKAKIKIYEKEEADKKILVSQIIDELANSIDADNAVKSLISQLKRKVKKQEEYFRSNEMKYLFRLSDQQKQIEDLKQSYQTLSKNETLEINPQESNKIRLFPYLKTMNGMDKKNETISPGKYKGKRKITPLALRKPKTIYNNQILFTEKNKNKIALNEKMKEFKNLVSACPEMKNYNFKIVK